MKVWLLEIAALDENDAAVTLRFSSSDYKTSGAPYENRLTLPALFEQGVSGTFLPIATDPGFGVAVLANADGELDYLVDYATDGRSATVKVADVADYPQNYATVETTVLTGTVRELRFNGSEVEVKLRDPIETLTRTHPRNVYAGTNSLPNGVEGVATDIKGSRKPTCYGVVSNAAAVLVNTAQLIYQIHDGSGIAIDDVFDLGSVLTDSGEQASLAALIASAPAAGNYTRFEGYFKLGATPVGEVTADATCTNTLAGDVFEQIATEVGYTVTAGSVTALNAIGTVGFQVVDDTSTRDLLDTITLPVGYWTTDGATSIAAGVLAAPGTPTATIEDFQVVDISRDTAGAGDNGLPIWRVVLNADRVEVVQTDTVAGAGARRARVARQYRDAVSESAATQTRHPLAAELQIETVLRDLTEAQTQADTLRDLLKVRRDTVSVRAYIDDVTLSALSIGTVVTLQTSRLGYTSGRDMIVIATTIDAVQGRVDFVLWG